MYSIHLDLFTDITDTDVFRFMSFALLAAIRYPLSVIYLSSISNKFVIL